MINEKIRYILSGIKASGIQADALHNAIDLLKEYKNVSHEYTKFRELVASTAEQMCESYCKFPELMLAQYKDPDDAERHLKNWHCRNCPFERLV